jgi:hypothetical protein
MHTCTSSFEEKMVDTKRADQEQGGKEDRHSDSEADTGWFRSSRSSRVVLCCKLDDPLDHEGTRNGGRVANDLIQAVKSAEAIGPLSHSISFHLL